MYLGPDPTPRNQWQTLKSVCGMAISEDTTGHLLNYSVNLGNAYATPWVSISHAISRPRRFASYKANKGTSSWSPVRLSKYRKKVCFRHSSVGRDRRLRKEIQQRRERKKKRFI